jgi:hypothetical protein
MPRPRAPFRFPRQDLARQLADAVSGVGPFSAGGAMFLAGPRRTGKSTFLRHDFVPELESRNIFPIYVDLWANKDEDPGKLIADAIKKALRDTDNLVVKTARKVGLGKVGVGSYASIDVDKIGAADGTTLTAALTALLDRIGKRICLIVDEAQHALTSETGVNAMFALKAARDALNMRDDARDGPNLLLVFTGSQRDKLSALVTKRDRPFFGSQVTAFPLLGRDFTDAYTAWLNETLAEDRRFQKDDVFEAFDLVGRRPEFLLTLLKDVAFGMGTPERLGDVLKESALIARKQVWEDHRRAFDSLSPIQQAVLGRLAEEGDAFAPFTKAALADYAAKVGEEVSTASAQSAIDSLREKNLVWKSARGTYALEEADFADWYREAKAVARAAGAAPSVR